MSTVGALSGMRLRRRRPGADGIARGIVPNGLVVGPMMAQGLPPNGGWADATTIRARPERGRDRILYSGWREDRIGRGGVLAQAPERPRGTLLQHFLAVDRNIADLDDVERRVVRQHLGGRAQCGDVVRACADAPGMPMILIAVMRDLFKSSTARASTAQKVLSTPSVWRSSLFVE